MDEKSAIFKVAYKFLGPDELEAFAAEEDPTKSWIHFIFTDDKPNVNNERVPVEEFDNIIKTGKYMPIKKYVGETSSTHEQVVPMGTIAVLKRELGETKNIIEGLGTLWKKEFPEDVAAVKAAFDDGEPVDFSWEILYSDSEEEEEGVSALRGCRTRAITIVDMPAYQGRTRALAMASLRESFEERQEKIRDALEKFKLTDDSYRYYLMETYSNTTVIKDREDGNFYELSYSVKDDGVTFNFDEKKKVEREYITVGSEDNEVDGMELLITGIASEEAIAAANESAKEAQRKRASKYGIQVRPGGHVTKPKEYVHLKDSQFADPVNYAYPISKEFIRAALRYWGMPKNKAKYNAKSRAIINQRMMAAARRLGVKSIKERKSNMNEKFKELLEGLEPADSVAAVSEELDKVFKELEALRTFKEEREEEEAKAVLLKSRIEKIKEAGLEVSDEDTEKKASVWLGMSDEAFDFHITELVAFSADKKKGEEATASTNVPDVSGETTDDDESPEKVLREGLEEILGRKSSNTEDK